MERPFYTWANLKSLCTLGWSELRLVFLPLDADEAMNRERYRDEILAGIEEERDEMLGLFSVEESSSSES